MVVYPNPATGNVDWAKLLVEQEDTEGLRGVWFERFLGTDQFTKRRSLELSTLSDEVA